MTAATVASYDAGTRSGTLLRDDGTPLSFDARALDPAVRFLRPGQRVRVQVDGATALTVHLAGAHSGA